MADELLINISLAVAEALDAQNLSGISTALNALFPAEMSQPDRAAALNKASVYSLVCEKPGYPDDGLPGYLPENADLKAAVLNEIKAMIAADFDKTEHRAIWESLQKSIGATADAEFALGIEVNCPDDYLLTLAKHSCGEILRKMNALPAWANA